MRGHDLRQPFSTSPMNQPSKSTRGSIASRARVSASRSRSLAKIFDHHRVTRIQFTPATPAAEGCLTLVAIRAPPPLRTAMRHNRYQIHEMRSHSGPTESQALDGRDDSDDEDGRNLSLPSAADK